MKHSIRSLTLVPPLRSGLLACLAACLAAHAAAQDTLLLSPGTGGGGGNLDSSQPSVSADGRFVVFSSLASDLVAGDTNGVSDVFLLDRESGTTELLSRNASGLPASGSSTQPTISANGRFVAFGTLANDLGLGPGVYMLDRVTGNLSAASVEQSVGLSRRGYDPRISPDGRYVVYSASHRLTSEDTNGSLDDVYRYDRVSDTLRLVSIKPSGSQSSRDAVRASISAGGRYVVFQSWASNWDAGYTGWAHVWLKDMLTDELEPVSKTRSGEPANGGCGAPDLSADGRHVTFQCVASNLVDVSGAQQIAAKDLVTGAVDQVSENDAGTAGNNYSYAPRISNDGRFVTFRSAANNLHLGGTNPYFAVYVRDRALGITRKVSLSSAATGSAVANAGAEVGALSLTGRFVVFSSTATNLVSADNNGRGDIFLRDRHGDAPYGYGFSPPHSSGCVPALSSTGTPSVSAGSGFVVHAMGVRGNLPGMLIYSTAGPATTPLLGQTLYLRAPIKRTSVQLSGGSSGSCNGTFALDFNALVGTSGHAGLVAGVSVYTQFWSRDNGDPGGAHFSAALAFELGN